MNKIERLKGKKIEGRENTYSQTPETNKINEIIDRLNETMLLVSELSNICHEITEYLRDQADENDQTNKL